MISILNSSSGETNHKWKFFRSGGFDQVRIETVNDLRNLQNLDQKLWAILSSPTTNIYFDKKMLGFLDSDHDQHVRVPDIIHAVKWLDQVLNDLSFVFKATDSITLSDINTNTESGKKVYLSAQLLLTFLNKKDTDCLTLNEVECPEKIFLGSVINGDGVITTDSVESEKAKEIITLIISTIGSIIDKNGKEGVDSSLVEQFYSELKNYSEWIQQAESNQSDIYFLHEKTESSFQNYQIVKQKIDDYFFSSQVLDFNQKYFELINEQPQKLSELDFNSLRNLLIADVKPNQPLSFHQGVNPSWRKEIGDFYEQVIIPIYGNLLDLNEQQWEKVKTKFSHYENWINQKPNNKVESLGLEKINLLLAENQKEILLDAINNDLSVKSIIDGFEDVEKLIRYCRYFIEYLYNFVSLSNFFTKQAKAIFQMGDLFIDGKQCELVVQVNDMTKHGELANLSGIFLIYCHLKNRTTNDVMTVAAAITNGNTDNIMVGRNGIFYDRDGQDWDATIIKVIDHAISIQQAFWEPYKRVARMISSQIEKWASSKDKEIESKSSDIVNDTADKMKKTHTTTVPAQPFDIGKFVGIFAAISLAIGAIGGALATVLTGFLGLVWWQMPLAIFGIILVISGPSMLMAWFKLRLRNLGPLLDANGWAVNTRATINIVFGSTLTKLATLPLGAERSLQDPFAEKKRPWKFYFFIVLVIALVIWMYVKGFLDPSIEWIISKFSVFLS